MSDMKKLLIIIALATFVQGCGLLSDESDIMPKQEEVELDEKSMTTKADPGLPPSR
jgi:hypothetical protein